ncbi:MAG: hypothetical protein AAF400_01350 [Bacteroidota bacterium]
MLSQNYPLTIRHILVLRAADVQATFMHAGHYITSLAKALVPKHMVIHV